MKSQPISQSANHPKYRPDIDGLRAIAVLAVVGFHAFPAWIRGGFVGVDIFFVISGFLISTILFNGMNAGTFSFLDFYGRRIRRIFPSLTVVLVACMIFGWISLLTEEYKQLGKHIAAGAGFVSNLVLWNESGYFDNVAETKPLLHLWSLGIEEQFYVFWPILLWLGWKKRAWLPGIIIGIAVMSFGYNVLSRGNSSTAFYSPQTRFWELLVGVILAYFSLCRQKAEYNHGLNKVCDHKLVSQIFSGFGVFLLVIGFVFISEDRHFPGYWALLPVLGAAMIIAAGPEAPFNRLVLSNRVLVWIGLISFPLYLWHWPLLSFLRIIYSESPSVGLCFAAIGASFILSWGTYRLVEQPIRFGVRIKKSTYGLMSAIVVVGCSGYAIFLNDGVPTRASVRSYQNNLAELIRTNNRDEACLNYVGMKDPEFYYCRLSDVGSSETVAVLGDSHAHAAYPGIANMFKGMGINTVLLANSGCPPFLGGEYGDDEKDKVKCRKRIEEILRVVKEKRDIRQVLIFSLGAIDITGTVVTEGYDHPKKLPQVPIPAEIFKRSLQKTIDFLNRAGKQVYYVTENPELDFDVKACLARPLRTARKNCEVKKGQVLHRQKEYLELVDTLTGVQVINPTNAFCKSEVCSAFSQETLLYVDNHHLSLAGSELQAKEVLSRYFK
ncbi:MAG: acyltransferase [Bdellovibrio sp. CG10_big_fil_rev_8_21_14_0_10_47_8]|nr:MAG: acyltransferase [Bdellovibrio sp. CG10_big_fil_rev_8_21_14_0_10_47_8]